MKIAFDKFLLQRILGTIIIILSFQWFKPLQSPLIKYMGTINASLIGYCELPIAVFLAIIGLTLFDHSFIDIPRRPKGITVFGVLSIASASMFMGIFKELKWLEQILFWNLEFVDVQAFYVILFMSMLTLFTGIGLLRLNLLAWKVTMCIVILQAANFLAWQYQFMASGGLRESLARSKAFFEATSQPDVSLQLEIRLWILIVAIYILLFAYLMKVRRAFNKNA